MVETAGEQDKFHLRRLEREIGKSPLVMDFHNVGVEAAQALGDIGQCPRDIADFYLEAYQTAGTDQAALND